MTGEARQTTGGRALVDALLAHQATHAYCVPGESYLPVLDALHDVSDRLRLITCRHEGGAANMAEAHGKLTGTPGLCFVTRGPGATNASIGVHTAFQDSTPMILFVGQVSSADIGREAFQEVDYRSMFSPLAKWVGEVPRADRIAEFVNRAWRVATAGRPGPVVLALPEDVLTASCPVQQTRSHPPVRAHPSGDDIDAVVAMLVGADRPLVILGGSGWDPHAIEAMAGFLARNDLPAAVSFRRQGLIDNCSDHYVGHLGIGANPALVSHLAEADLVLALGPRLGEMTTDGYRRIAAPVPHQRLIHVHPGAEELGRVYQGARLINSSTTAFVDAIADADIEGAEARADWRRRLRRSEEDWRTPVGNPGAVQIADIWRHVSTVLAPDAIITNGAGNYTAWLHRFYDYRRPGSQIAPTSGAMGYGVPAAIAAKIAAPDREVIAAAGDGCFLMTGQELATAVQYDARIIILVFNNGQYGTIRMHQERHYPGRVTATSLVNPDFAALAESYGAAGFRISRTDDFKAAFAEARRAGRPALIEIAVDPEAISPTARLSDLAAAAPARQQGTGEDG